MKRVGIIGLGDMGIAMARNIIKSGFELIGFDLREERLQMLEEASGKRAASPAKVASSSDVVFVTWIAPSRTPEARSRRCTRTSESR